MFSLALVRLLAGLYRNGLTDFFFFTKFGEQVAHRPRNKPLDLVGNPEHSTVEYSAVYCRVRVGLGLQLSGAQLYSASEDVRYMALFY